MIRTTCPRCGTAAEMLLNLVQCVSPKCRFYNPKWAIRWSERQKPYFHNDFSNLYIDQERFLGNFTSKDGSKFDLYHTYGYRQGNICWARYGDGEDQIWYHAVDKGEIGRAVFGRQNSISASLEEALQQSEALWKSMYKDA